MTGTPAPFSELDSDRDGQEDALTDALLVLRYVFGFRDAALITGAYDSINCDYCTADEIETHIASILHLLDIDDSGGSPDALTDGLLVLRYLFGFRGTVLTTGAVNLLDCNRCTAALIEPHLESLVD
jgi:hypothetical protein